MIPICGLEVFLIATRCPAWMQGTAAIVLAFSAIGLAHGYLRRLALTKEMAALVGLLGRIEIPWAQVRSVGVYVPGGGVGATEYAYVTRRDAPPRGKWDIDLDTIQVQNRPGLMEAITWARRAAEARNDVGMPSMPAANTTTQRR
jgi:hypothetical protein